MKTIWFGVALALLGGLALVSVASPAQAQQLAPRDNSANTNIGAEYRVMLEYLTKFTEAMQGSTDKDSTVTNLTALPEKTGVDLKGTAKEEGTATAERSFLAKREEAGGLGGAGFLSWVFSKEFNIDDPFEAPLKREKIERAKREPAKEDEVDTLDSQIDSPQFSYIIGLSKAMNEAFLPRERVIQVKGQEKEDADFGAFSLPTDNEKKD